MKDLKPMLTARKFELRDMRCEWIPSLQVYEVSARVFTEERGETLVSTYAARARIDSSMTDDHSVYVQRGVVRRAIAGLIDSALLLDGKPLEKP
jgi:hypothetical protein